MKRKFLAIATIICLCSIIFCETSAYAKIAGRLVVGRELTHYDPVSRPRVRVVRRIVVMPIVVGYRWHRHCHRHPPFPPPRCRRHR